MARFTVPSIDIEPVLKAPAAAQDVSIIAQRGPPPCDGAAQDGTDARVEAFRIGRTQGVGGSTRVDPGYVASFAGVDVSDAGDLVLIEEQVP
jgi:hypothetical protein